MRTKDVIDLRPTTSGDGSLSPTTINIIEQNTGTQVNVKVLYTEITWVGGLPSVVKKYTDNTKAVQVYDITLNWLDGLPITVVSINLDDNITTTTTIEWVDGVPSTINKVES